MKYGAGRHVPTSSAACRVSMTRFRRDRRRWAFETDNCTRGCGFSEATALWPDRDRAGFRRVSTTRVRGVKEQEVQRREVSWCSPNPEQ
jgi:hypothetical protein